MPEYNVHTHVFTMNNAPEHFLHLYLPGFLADAVGKVTNTTFGSWVVRKLLSATGEGGKKYASFLQIGKSKSQLEVFENLILQYPNEEMKFVALTLYMEKCGAGNSLSGFEGQLEEIMEVKRRYPDRLLIFMGIDPRWKRDGKALKETVESYFEKKIRINANREVYPFAGLKLYPSTGFYPFDKNLKETFEWAAETGVPIISHCYYKGGIYNNSERYIKSILNSLDPYSGEVYSKPAYIKEKSWKWIIGQKASLNNRKSCSYFLEPEAYRSIYDHFNKKDKPLKLCLAHFGGAEEMRRTTGDESLKYKSPQEPYGILRKNWFEQIKSLMTAFMGAYTDISYTVAYDKTHPLILATLKNVDYGNKVMYGTDYYMTEQDKTERLIFSDFNKSAIAEPGIPPAKTAWEQVSEINTHKFLTSKYYP